MLEELKICDKLDIKKSGPRAYFYDIISICKWLTPTKFTQQQVNT